MVCLPELLGEKNYLMFSLITQIPGTQPIFMKSELPRWWSGEAIYLPSISHYSSISKFGKHCLQAVGTENSCSVCPRCGQHPPSNPRCHPQEHTWDRDWMASSGHHHCWLVLSSKTFYFLKREAYLTTMEPTTQWGRAYGFMNKSASERNFIKKQGQLTVLIWKKFCTF